MTYRDENPSGSDIDNPHQDHTIGPDVKSEEKCRIIHSCVGAQSAHVHCGRVAIYTKSVSLLQCHMCVLCGVVGPITYARLPDIHTLQHHVVLANTPHLSYILF